MSTRRPESAYVKTDWSEFEHVEKGLNGVPAIFEFCAAHIKSLITADVKHRKMFFKLAPHSDTVKAINIINRRQTIDGVFRYFHGDPEGLVATAIILHVVKSANGFYSVHVNYDMKRYRFTETILRTSTTKMSEQKFEVLQLVYELILKVLEDSKDRSSAAKALGGSLQPYLVHLTFDRSFGLTEADKPKKPIIESVEHVLNQLLAQKNLEYLRQMRSASSAERSKT